MAVLLIVLGAAAARAEEEPKRLTNKNGYVYTLDADGRATIVGYTGKEKKLNIPSKLDGHAVVCIGAYAFDRQGQITENRRRPVFKSGSASDLVSDPQSRQGVSDPRRNGGH